MMGGHREIHLRDGPMKEGVDGCERTNAPQLHALCG